MEKTSVDPKYKVENSWTLVAFRDAFGKMQRGISKDKDGVEFASLSFTHPTTGIRTYVAFGSSLGAISAEEIKAQVDKLQVVKLATGAYRLCKAGNSTWEDIDF